MYRLEKKRRWIIQNSKQSIQMSQILFLKGHTAKQMGEQDFTTLQTTMTNI